MKRTLAFFATSHGKSPCDGIGGAVKRLTSIDSLHRTTNNHILMKIIIIGISFYYISKESNMIIRSEMEQRFTTAKTLQDNCISQFPPFK